jgi:hypothetical protein
MAKKILFGVSPNVKVQKIALSSVRVGVLRVSPAKHPHLPFTPRNPKDQKNLFLTKTAPD